MSGSINFQPSAEDLGAAYALNMSRSWRKNLTRFLLIGAIFGVLMAVSIYDGGPRHVITVASAGLFFVLAMLVIYAAARFLWLPRFSKRIFTQQKDLHEATTISWNADGFSATNSSGHSLTPWADFYGWKRGKTMFLLFRSEALFNFLPMAEPAFATGADEMIHFLTAAGVPEK